MASAIDGVFVLSQHEKDLIPKDVIDTIKQHGGLGVLVTRNGLASREVHPYGLHGNEIITQKINDPDIFIYPSQPTYGLESLLMAWPEIRRGIPNATLEGSFFIVVYALMPILLY